MILVLLALAQFMVVLDTSVANVALPSIQRAFHISPTNLQWIITAYTLAFGGFLLLGGRAADLYGRKKMFLTGISLFTIASLIDGLSQSGGMLIGLRAAQGTAAALMSPAALSIVLITYKEGHERNRALAVWGAVASGGAAAGVLLGGILTQYLNWRWNFFINVPVGVAVVALAWRILPKHEGEARDNQLDLPGAVTVTGGTMLLVYALSKAPSVGWTAGSTLAYFAASAILFILFVANERRAQHPLVPLSIFKIRNVTGANLVQMLNVASLFSMFFFTSLYMQTVLGYSPARSGLAFLIIPVIIAVAATIAPTLIKRFGYKPILVLSPLFISTGLLLLGRLPVHGHYVADLLPSLILISFMGFNFVSTTIAATSGVPANESGLASGLLNTAQQIGGALGLAILSGVAASHTTHLLQHSAAHGQAAVTAATVGGYHAAFYTGAGLSLLGSVLALVIIKQRAKGAIGEEAAPAAAMH